MASSRDKVLRLELLHRGSPEAYSTELWPEKIKSIAVFCMCCIPYEGSKIPEILA